MSAPVRPKRALALRKQDDAMAQFHNELAAVVDKYAPILDAGNALLVVGHLQRALEKVFDNTRPKGA